MNSEKLKALALLGWTVACEVAALVILQRAGKVDFSQEVQNLSPYFAYGLAFLGLAPWIPVVLSAKSS